LPLGATDQDESKPTEAFSNISEHQFEQFRTQLTVEAQKIKYEQLESLQDKATGWVKRQFMLATVVIGAVGAFLAFVGIQNFNVSEELKQKASEVNDEIDNRANEVLSQTNAVEAILQKLQQDADKKVDDFNQKIALGEKIFDEKLEKLETLDVNKIQEYEKQLKQTVAQVTLLKTDLKTSLDTAEQQLERIKKLENGRFRILLHYRDSTRENYLRNIEKLENILFPEGFNIDHNDIANVGSDREEIIYYSSAKNIVDKVQEIEQLVSNGFRSIPVRYESAGKYDPFQILIKLCAQKEIDGSCGQNKSDD
jgi:hypothetical protein